jgi:hypothetical protein
MTEIRFVSWCHWGISFWIGERNHGYPIAPAHVQVWSSECQGCTIGHQPLHEVVS